MKLPVIRFLLKITGSEKGDEDHHVKTGIWSYRMYLIGNDGTYMWFKGVHFMLELAGSSVVDWVQGIVTKALSELQVSKHKTGQYAHNIIISSSAPYKRLINDVNKPTNRPTNNRRIETDQWLLTNSTRVFQPITSRLNRPIPFNRQDLITSSTDNYSLLDSEDDFCTGCRNVSHQQQFFS